MCAMRGANVLCTNPHFGNHFCFLLFPVSHLVSTFTFDPQAHAASYFFIQVYISFPQISYILPQGVNMMQNYDHKKYIVVKTHKIRTTLT
jgi:hypothetical protein